MTDDLIVNLHRSVDFVERVLAQIGDDVRTAPTPCPEYDVTDLASHVITGTHWYGVIPEQGAGDPSAFADVDMHGRNLPAEFRPEADLVRRAWTAEQLSKEFVTPFGPMLGVHLTGYEVMELVGHGLDLVLAIGSSLRPDNDLVEVGMAVAEGMGEGLRGPKMMGPAVPVPSDATVVDRFLGLLGRDPAWSPTGPSSS